MLGNFHTFVVLYADIFLCVFFKSVINNIRVSHSLDPDQDGPNLNSPVHEVNQTTKVAARQ